MNTALVIARNFKNCSNCQIFKFIYYPLLNQVKELIEIKTSFPRATWPKWQVRITQWGNHKNRENQFLCLLKLT